MQRIAGCCFAGGGVRLVAEDEKAQKDILSRVGQMVEKVVVR